MRFFVGCGARAWVKSNQAVPIEKAFLLVKKGALKRSARYSAGCLVPLKKIHTFGDWWSTERCVWKTDLVFLEGGLNHVNKMAMDSRVVTEFGMKGCNEHVVLLRGHNAMLYGSKHVNVVTDVGDIRGANEIHRYVANAFEGAMNKEAAELATVGIAFGVDIHGAKARGAAVDGVRQKQEAGTGAKYGHAIVDAFQKRGVEVQIVQEFTHGGAFAAGDDESVDAVCEVFGLANIKVFNA